MSLPIPLFHWSPKCPPRFLCTRHSWSIFRENFLLNVPTFGNIKKFSGRPISPSPYFELAHISEKHDWASFLDHRAVPSSGSHFWQMFHPSHVSDGVWYLNLPTPRCNITSQGIWSLTTTSPSSSEYFWPQDEIFCKQEGSSKLNIKNIYHIKNIYLLIYFFMSYQNKCIYIYFVSVLYMQYFTLLLYNKIH